MTKLQDRLNEINEKKEFINNHLESIELLQQEVDKADVPISEMEREYKDLVIKGDSVEADKLYTEISQAKDALKAKKNRLAVLKESSKTFVNDNWKELRDLVSPLQADYKEEYEDVVNRYIEAKLMLEKSEAEIEALNNEYKSKISELAISQSVHFRAVDLSGIVMTLGGGDVFYESYLNAQEKEYRNQHQ